MTEHKLLDLFSGIGGFSFAADKFGIETIGFVEKDEFCQKVLKKHWKNVPIESDIRNVKGDNYGSATIVSGGFPCQPFSTAGKRKGTDDDRYLWDETIRVVAECKPRWFIGENVDGLVNIQDGMVLRQVQDDLEKEGFQVQCLVIPASGVGAWHQRKRVWIIAFSEHNGLYRPKGDATIKSSNQSEEWVSIGDDKNVSNTKSIGNRRKDRNMESENEKNRAEGREITISKFINDSKNVSNTNSGELHGCMSTSRLCGEKLKGLDSNEEKDRNKVWSETERCGEQVTDRGNVSDSQCERLERHSKHNSTISRENEGVHFRNENSRGKNQQQSWWQTQSELCGVPNGVSYELHKGRVGRIKALGNSIVPQIAEQLFKSIIYAEQ